MSTETTFTWRWKRLSPAFLLVIVITVVGLVVAFGLPRLILPRFTDKPTTLNFQVVVTDEQGIPVANANVVVGTASAQTDLEGQAEVRDSYPAKGIKGLTATCRLEGEIRVEAPGFVAWRGDVGQIFGRNFDYFEKGSNLPRQVTLYC
jgi:hypothetical protein